MNLSYDEIRRIADVILTGLHDATVAVTAILEARSVKFEPKPEPKPEPMPTPEPTPQPAGNGPSGIGHLNPTAASLPS